MDTAFSTLLGILDELQEARIHHTLAHVSDNAVMVQAAVPGQRWEIEVLSDGSVEMEVFVSDGTIHDRDYLQQSLHRYRD